LADRHEPTERITCQPAAEFGVVPSGQPRLGGGQLNIYNAAGSTQVVVDLVGYYQDTSDVPGLNGEAHFITGTADPAANQGAIGDMYINNTNGLL
jgi:hypothetical protein